MRKIHGVLDQVLDQESGRAIEDKAQKITITAPDGLTTATFVPELGGLGVSITMPDSKHPSGKRELLYLPEDFDWKNPSKVSGGLPICFPICGRLKRDGEEGAYIFDGKRYKMGIHGFATTLPWELLYAETDQLGMRLTYTEETLKIYPFEFEIELHYEIKDGELICRHRYANLSDNQVMCYYAGFHPYFLIDPKRYTKDQVFLCAETSGQFFYNKNLDDIVDSNEIPVTLSAPLSSPDLNEKLFYFNEEAGFEMHFPDGAIIGMDIYNFPGELNPSFPFMQLYHAPEKPFFCVEPWMSHPNALNTQLASHVLFPSEFEEAVFKISMKSWE
jgi:galactose mutarotase-like enzyme